MCLFLIYIFKIVFLFKLSSHVVKANSFGSFVENFIYEKKNRRIETASKLSAAWAALEGFYY